MPLKYGSELYVCLYVDHDLELAIAIKQVQKFSG
jgi:hypothetical protein